MKILKIIQKFSRFLDLRENLKILIKNKNKIRKMDLFGKNRKMDFFASEKWNKGNLGGGNSKKLEVFSE